jgi:hypothetical protein
LLEQNGISRAALDIARIVVSAREVKLARRKGRVQALKAKSAVRKRAVKQDIAMNYVQWVDGLRTTKNASARVSRVAKK